MNVARDSLQALLELFDIRKKRDIESYCKDLIVTSEALADLLLCGRIAGLGPYNYACHFDELVPSQLKPTEAQLNALGRTGIGRIAGPALSAVRKMEQSFRDRRMLAVHVFYSRSLRYWHMFYFDQRDYARRNNHWKFGSHIHYSHDSFTRDSLPVVWGKVTQPTPAMPRSIHVQYDYHHNRRPGA